MFDIRDLNPMLTPMFVDMPVSDFSAMLENANDSTTHDYTKLRELGLKLGIPDPEQTDEYGDLIDSNLDAWNDWIGALSTNYHRFAYTRHETPLSTVDAAADVNSTLNFEVELPETQAAQQAQARRDMEAAQTMAAEAQIPETPEQPNPITIVPSLPVVPSAELVAAPAVQKRIKDRTDYLLNGNPEDASVLGGYFNYLDERADYEQYRFGFNRQMVPNGGYGVVPGVAEFRDNKNDLVRASFDFNYKSGKLKQSVESAANTAALGVDSWILPQAFNNKKTLQFWYESLDNIDEFNSALTAAKEQFKLTKFDTTSGREKELLPEVVEIDKASVARNVVWENTKTHPLVVKEAQSIIYGKSGLLESVLDRVEHKTEFQGFGSKPKLTVSVNLPNWSEYPDEFIVDFVEFYSSPERIDVPIGDATQYSPVLKTKATRNYKIPENLLQSAVLYLSGMSQEDIDFVLQEEQ
jgi:hypothetical protein